MPQYRFDHLQLFSPNPDSTARWYAEVLGARIRKETENPRMRHLFLDLNGAIIEVGGPLKSGAGAADLAGRRAGLERFGLKVDNLDDAVHDLKARGVRLLGDIRMGSYGRRVCHVEAPENLDIELLEGDFTYWR